MNTQDISKATLFRVGIFTFLGLALIGVLTVFVNDRPFWWRKCNPVFIQVEDATGLKTKSPVRSLGIQVGYLRSVDLLEARVKLGICLTAPVEVLPETRAYIRGEGFLGDKFVELKPVHFTGGTTNINSVRTESHWYARLNPISSAYAEDQGKEVQVGQRAGDMDKLMEKADELMKEMTGLTKNLKEGLDPKDLKSTIQQLNKTLEAASKTLSPKGDLNSTAKRSLEKLEDAFEQLRQQMTRINHGEGSLGRLLNDPVYADELLKASKSLNKLLNKVSDVRFIINMGAQQIPVYDGGRGFFQLGIWPTDSRYYLVGITLDPRGKRTVTNSILTAGGQQSASRLEQTEEGGILLTGMIGKVFFRRMDLAAGALYGDGTVSVGMYLGPTGLEDAIILRNDVYSRGQGIALNDRVTLQLRPLAAYKDLGLNNLYLQGGLDSVRKINEKYAYFFGAGITFDDEDIKLLFAFK